MKRNRVISQSELNRYADGAGLANEVKALFRHQVDNCPAVREGYDALKNVEVKTFEYDGFEVRVQFNAGRIKSSSAKVDKKSIEKRPCFLCAENLLPGQLAVEYFRSYYILCNPFPIFDEHFTIPKIEHLPQLLKGKAGVMLDISKYFENRYTSLYNGPECGASAPDHMHFQAGGSGFLPVEADYENLKNSLVRPLFERKELSAFASKNYLRNFIAFESNNKPALINAINATMRTLAVLKHGNAEPMVNIITLYKNDGWIVIIFPRRKHRPKQYFDEGEKRIMLSPASVDLGGVCITPREEDFEKIGKDDVADIYRQVSLSKEEFYFLTEKAREF